MKYGVPELDSVLRGLKLLDAAGVIDVCLPELARCRGIEQNPKFHRYNVLEHMFYTAAMSKPDLKP